MQREGGRWGELNVVNVVVFLASDGGVCQLMIVAVLLKSSI